MSIEAPTESISKQAGEGAATGARPDFGRSARAGNGSNTGSIPPSPARRPSITPAGRVVLAVSGVIAAYIGWRVLTLGLADSFVDSDSKSALYWRPENPEALLSAAQVDFQNHDFRGAKALALSAASHYPLDGRSFSVLADSYDFFGDKKTAEQLYELALRHAPRDMNALGKVGSYNLKEGRIEEALHYLDIELQMYPEVLPRVMPGLVQLSAYPIAQVPLGKLLAKRPQWRIAFLALLASAGGDKNGIDRIFANRGGDDPLPAKPPKSALDTSVDDAPEDSEPTGFTEADLLINRQLADGRWAAAHAIWAASLSEAEKTRAGYVFDGNFVFPPKYHKIDWLNLSTKGFGWQLPHDGTGYDVTIAPRSNYSLENVLQITFNGLPINYDPVKQLLVLPPGHYRMSAMGQAGGMTNEQGLRWVIACAMDKKQTMDHQAEKAFGGVTQFTGGNPFSEKILGRSMPFLGEIPYGAFSFEFDVPVPVANPTTAANPGTNGSAATTIGTNTDCNAQWLRLDLGTGLYLGIPLQGGAIFDHFDIERLGDPTKPAPLATPSPASKPSP